MSLRDQKIEELAGLSARTVLISIAGILLFGIYVGVLLYGENSVTVLKHLKQKENNLTQEKALLKQNNEQLQKKYFELQQILPPSQK